MTAELSFVTRSPQETQALGRVIGRKAKAGDVYLLTGPLGAGKTCLTQGIARGLGIEGYVRSPTFVLMTQHRGGRLMLHHVDLYRVSGQWEAWDLGIEESIFGDGVCVVEWAERATEVFPAECLSIGLEYGPEEGQRAITLHDPCGRYDEIMDKVAALVNSDKASL